MNLDAVSICQPVYPFIFAHGEPQELVVANGCREVMDRKYRCYPFHGCHEQNGSEQPSARQPSSVPSTRRYGMAYKQSDTPPVLAPGCEEFKCDVVGISKRQCRVVSRVHDATVGDAEFVQTDFPCL